MSHLSRRGLLKMTLTGTLGAAMVFAAGCSSRPPTNEDTRTAAAEQITVTDQRGREVVIDGSVDTAAFAVIPAPSIFAAVDRSHDRIVGINQSTLTANQQGMFSTIFPESANSPTISGPDFVPNVETILNLNPDVVIQWGDRGDEVIKPIEDAGFPVVGLEYGTQEDLETWITLFSELLQKPERGEEIIAWQRERRDDIAERVSALGAEAPRAMMLSAKDGNFTTSNGQGYDGFQYPLAGADFVSRDFLSESGQVNPEQILEWDPQVILLSGFDDSTPDDIYNDTRLADVTAVKERRVYKNPLGAYRWQVPSAESPLYWQWLNEVLHPNQEIAPTESLRTRMKEAFDELYGYAISEDEIDAVLRFDVNGGSADYGQFNR